MGIYSRYAFIDESGNTDMNAGKMLVISAVVTDNPILLARTVKDAEKKIRKIKKKDCGEMKAAFQRTNTRKKVLSSLIKCDFDVFSLVLDLATIDNTPYKFDDIYTAGMCMLCDKVYSANPDIHFILDKRYTKETLRNSLDKSIKELINYHHNTCEDDIDILHGDSIEYAELRAADYVVYETYQKFSQGSDAYDIFAGRVEDIIYYSNTTWGKIKKESRTPHL